MLGDQLRQKGTIHTPRHVVPCRNREEGTSIVVEAHRIVEARRLRYVLAETHHSFWTVVKPPRRPEPQAGIVPGQWRQFPTVGRFIQREKDDRQIALIAELIEQRAKCIHVVRRHRNVRDRLPCRRVDGNGRVSFGARSSSPPMSRRLPQSSPLASRYFWQIR